MHDFITIFYPKLEKHLKVDLKNISEILCLSIKKELRIFLFTLKIFESPQSMIVNYYSPLKYILIKFVHKKSHYNIYSNLKDDYY